MSKGMASLGIAEPVAGTGFSFQRSTVSQRRIVLAEFHVCAPPPIGIYRRYKGSAPKAYSDAEIAAMVNYVTGRFGARAATITSVQVARHGEEE